MKKILWKPARKRFQTLFLTGLGLAALCLLTLALVPDHPNTPCPQTQTSKNEPSSLPALGVTGPRVVLQIGMYIVRLDPPKAGPYLIQEVGCPAEHMPTFSIWLGDTKMAEEGFVEALDPHTGEDVNGDGYLDAIVHLYSGGAHCCYATVLYSLGPSPIRYVVEPGSNCPGEFRDLDGDGVYEFLTCDDSFAYRFCPFAQSPLVRVVLKFMPGQGYVPASPEFPEIYAEEIAQHRAQAEETLNQGPFPDRDGSPKSVVLVLVLDYLYSGQPEKAWEALYHYYRYPDVEGLRRAIEDTVRRSCYSPGCLEGLEG